MIKILGYTDSASNPRAELVLSAFIDPALNLPDDYQFQLVGECGLFDRLTRLYAADESDDQAVREIDLHYSAIEYGNDYDTLHFLMYPRKLSKADKKAADNWRRYIDGLLAQQIVGRVAYDMQNVQFPAVTEEIANQLRDEMETEIIELEAIKTAIENANSDGETIGE